MDKRLGKGSLTVEAALFLTFFLMGFLTIINFARLTRAEVVVQRAINGTAMQISQYGYLLTKTGIYDAMEGTAQEAVKQESDISQLKSAVTDLAGAIDQTSLNGVTNQTVEDLAGAVSGAQGAVDIVQSYFQNPAGLMTGLLAVAKYQAQQEVCTLLVSRIAESQVEAYLKEVADDPDAYLRELGVVGGMHGLDFQDSRLMNRGSKDVQITVRFKVKNQMFPNFDFGEYEMMLNASTRFW